MGNTLYRNNKRNAFVSFPIILLLLFVTTLSYGFYQTLSDERQWRYQQQNTLNNQAIWQAFEMDVAFQTALLIAVISQCDGFCTIDNVSEAEWFQEYDFLVNNNVEKLYWFFAKSSQQDAYSRLCAWRKETDEKKCWWYVQNSQENAGTLFLLGSMPM